MLGEARRYESHVTVALPLSTARDLADALADSRWEETRVLGLALDRAVAGWPGDLVTLPQVTEDFRGGDDA